MISNNKELKKLFYDVSSGFVSIDKFYKKVQLNGLKYTKKEVKIFYDAQTVKQVLKPTIKQKQYNSIIAYFPRHIYQMDIIVYDRYEYNKYKYMLVVIDINSRYLQVRPMTSRSMVNILKAYRSIIKVMKIPEQLHSDNEFNKAEFLEELSKDGTTFRFSDPNEMHKNAIVERVNGTIALFIQKVRIGLKRYDWNNYIFYLVNNYNTTYHSTIKNTP
jgi:hypothetical protein